MRRGKVRATKAREDPDTRAMRGLQSELLPEAQRGNGFVLTDVSNFTDADQRHMVRSQKRQTLRRQPKLHELYKRGILDVRQMLACEWFSQCHSLRYDTTNVSARWDRQGGSGTTNFDHLPKNREQQDAYDNFKFARAGISPSLLDLFEAVVLKGAPLGNRALAFRIAVGQLLKRIEGRVSL